MKKKGLPANVNPFCVIGERDLCEGLLNNELPHYFLMGKGRWRWTRLYKKKDLDDNWKPLPGRKPNKRGWEKSEYTCARRSVRSGSLSQEKAEKLVRIAHGLSPSCQVAIQKQYSHIVPEDLRREIALSPNRRARCSESELVRNCHCFDNDDTPKGL